MDWLNIVIFIVVLALFIVLAFAVLKMVANRSFPDFAWEQWIQDSVAAWRNKELDTSEFNVKVADTSVTDFFPGFDPGPDPAVKLPSFNSSQTESTSDSPAE